MKKRIIAVTAALAVAASSAAFASPAEELRDKGILSGYEDGQLHLERTLTRAEFTKIFCDAFLTDDEVKADAPDFPDVPDGHWAKDYIAAAYGAGVISGFDDGTFRPDDTVTYEQAVKIIMSRLNYSGSVTYPEGYVGGAVNMGISDNVHALIGDTITREDVVYLIDNALKKIEDDKREAEEDSESIQSPAYLWGGGSSSSGSSSNSSAGSSVRPSVGGSSSGNKSGASLGANPDGSVGFESSGGGGGGSVAHGNYAPVPAPETEYDYNGYFNTEEYTSEDENVFKNALTSPLSTFSIDADTASYSNLRRFALGYGMFPKKGSIRSEELINYFTYDNPRPTDGKPFEVSAETAVCPWNSEHLLTKIAVQGDELTEKQPTNLVFLIDVSGSMYTAEKLPLVKKSLRMLLDELDENDTVSIVTYASGTRVALDSTPVSEKDKILEAIASLRAGGGTYGEVGINLAYLQAEKNLIEGNNRIILCTDGDFNIGMSSTGDLKDLISEKREKGIFLTVLGFGMGNYKDNRMETLADSGNGTYAYIDTEREAEKVFVDEMPKTLYTIAKDVKIQTEFNPAAVKEYRLVGYENRILNNEDFDNDKKDAGELGCGATVTALYEIVPADGTETAELKYRSSEITGSADELMTVKLRYKDPAGDESKLIEMPVANSVTSEMSSDFKFASAVAELGMLLNDSEFVGTADYDSVISLAREGVGDDPLGFRTEFLHIADILRYISVNRGMSPTNDTDLPY